MDDDQFTKLFKYIEEFRTEVNTKLDQKASQDSMERALEARTTKLVTHLKYAVRR